MWGRKSNNLLIMNFTYIFLNEGERMKWKIDDAPIFISVVEQNGITAAANALGIPKSTVSNAMSRLEDALQLKLIERGPRSLRVTSEGETFFRHCQTIVEQVREADAAMAGHTTVPSGRLTVAIPPAFCQEILAPKFVAFRNLYPEIELDLVITTLGLELVRDHVDLAIVVGPLEDSELISKALISAPLKWVTSPSYARQIEGVRDIQAIMPHIFLCEKRYGQVRVPVHVDGKPGHVDLRHGISQVNDPLVVRRAVLNGAGVSVLPVHYCRDQLADGSLVEVFQHITFDVAASKLTAIYPSRRLVSPRVRVFIEFISKICRDI
jgi:DNA-binding transcriptional LysR family regulator